MSDANTSNNLTPNTLTIEEVKLAVPAKLKVAVTQDLVDKLNTASNDPILAKNIQDNFITYSMVLREGKYKIEDYFNAIKFCTYKIMGLSNTDAYKKTFPIRHQTMLARGATEKDISSFVAAYFRNHIVQSILEKTIIPFHILNQDARQEALNVQVQLMMTAKSEMVRMKAADSVLAHTEAPTATGPLLNVNINKSSAMEDLERTITDLARIQKQAIEDNLVSTRDIAEQRIVEAEVVEATEDTDGEDYE